ncbi:hypothetical protein LWI28_006777 [Acer negundo]|uniref:RNase H type-1 domain-containing protein n=1 Tax=Acer negundo TaxID=4023 RepID=A0AAD5J4W4_ACENE|nr:hypothetical protein LWI28_006777 [Acer negundo]
MVIQIFGVGSSEDLTLLLDIEGRCVDRQPTKVIRPCSWSPPMDNDLIFNIDGSARGSPGLARIDGVMRDASGKFLCLFSSFVGSADSNVAEVLAIHIACELISSCLLLSDHNITIRVILNLLYLGSMVRASGT